MGKIDIVIVSDAVFSHKGFDERGCYGSQCNDACCRMGADVDRESYDLIMQHREAIQQRLGRNLDACFEKEWSGQPDFLGNDSIATIILNGFCALHLSGGRGCVLFQFVTEAHLPKRMVPSTCRLYPVTWNNGTVELFKGIENTCNCLDPGNGATRKLWDTQKEAIEDIFSVMGQQNPVTRLGAF